MSKKKETFLITVAILEGRHYMWLNMDSVVIVKIADQKKTTAVKKNTDSPCYNEYFVFEFFATLEMMLDKSIEIMVIQPGNCWRKRKTLGYVSMDVATVWYQKNHQFYHKWAILTTPKSEIFTGPRGYVKTDIAILAKGSIPQIPSEPVNDEIEGNLLLPEGIYTERQKARYIFDVYKCLNIVEKVTNLVRDTDTTNNDEKLKGGPTTYVEITFAGISVKTSTAKNTSSPVFNEQLTITDLFPSLCQRIKVELCLGDKMRKHVHSVRYIDLKSISNDKEDGFLPTFGPIFLHLYTNNNLDGHVATILLGMRTELEELTLLDNRKTTMVQAIPPLNQSLYFDMNDVTLCCCIFDVYSIPKKYSDKPLSLLMTFGNVQLQKQPNRIGDTLLANMTIAKKPLKSGKYYHYLKFAEKKECLWIQRGVPYSNRRLYHSNVLDSTARGLREKIDEIQNMFESPNYHSLLEQIESKLTDAFDYIAVSCRKYIDIVSSYDVMHQTVLDIERRRLCLREMKCMILRSGDIQKFHSKTKRFRKLMNMLRNIESLIDDVQDCWPYIYLWIVQSNRKIAVSRIAARELVYSPIEEERGQFCAKRRTIIFQAEGNEKNNLLCIADITMLLYLDKHLENIQKLIPKGFHFDEEIENMPRFFNADEKFMFQLNAYLFQGQIAGGLDKTGLADGYVRVVLVDQIKETQCAVGSLNPIWNETLIFNNVILYGSKEFIAEHVTNVFIELWDKDMCGSELIGRIMLKPALRLANVDGTSPMLLSWHKIELDGTLCAELLCGVELIEQSEIVEDSRNAGGDSSEKVRIPPNIKPELKEYRVEIYFWGVRNLGKVNCLKINKPRISVICQNDILSSDVMVNARQNPNFQNPVKSMNVILPTQAEYAPPLRIRIFDSRKFGVFVLAGIHITNLNQFKYFPITSQEREIRLSSENRSSLLINLKRGSTVPSLAGGSVSNGKFVSISTKTDSTKTEPPKVDKKSSFLKCCYDFFCTRKIPKFPKITISKTATYEPLPQDDTVDENDFDWWTKFFASLEGEFGSTTLISNRINKLKVYQNELEYQPEFGGFTDVIRSFEMHKGKKTGDKTIDVENITAIFKGSIKIYRWPLDDNQIYLTECGFPLQNGVFQNFPENDLVRYLLRVYCVRALGLRPKDINGKSDPYLQIVLNDKTVIDKEHVVVRSVNPVFGRCFELSGTFPHDHTLKISVWDYDVTTSDDLIGETEIDLEERFFTKHRASCGIPECYEETGYCAWRGVHKPTALLADTCRKFNLDSPEYLDFSVRICQKEFFAPDFNPTENRSFDKEVLALSALRRWHEMPLVGFYFVPEHVETRSLFHPTKPGIEQGKIQLWIDILPVTDMPPPDMVDITPRKPQKYELRVIVWNTADVVLDEDDFFTGERKCDIYVKGWVIDSTKAQFTDVHYRSLTGEGNFNWRFIFPFEYLPTENKIVIRKKETFFAIDETEIKMPCKLNLQVWDNDTFSENDFLGTLSLELAKLHRPARSDKKCTLTILSRNAPRLNLFKIKRTKGWWPFKNVDQKSREEICAGKIEVELELLTEEEAKSEPAGMGRREPQPLPPPKRPDTSFNWFRNPLKALRYVVCKLHRTKILTCLFFLVLIIFCGVAFYALPGYTVKKFLGAK